MTPSWLDDIFDEIDRKKTAENKSYKNIYHSKCGGIAFQYSGSTEKGEIMSAVFAKYPDGRTPIDGQRITCAACGKNCSSIDLSPRECRQ